MITQEQFPTDLTIHSDSDFGLRIECSAKYADKIKGNVVNHSYSCGQNEIVIEGTINIHDTVGFSIQPNEFIKVKTLVIDFLTSAGVEIEDIHTEEDGREESRLELKNISVFDKN